jgi:hypothetical protein
MNGSLRLRAMIARRVHERAGNRRAGRANLAASIAALVMHEVQAVGSGAIALSTSTEHTRSRRQLSGREEERVLALNSLHFDQHTSRFSDAKFNRLYRLSKQDHARRQAAPNLRPHAHTAGRLFRLRSGADWWSPKPSDTLLEVRF